MFANDRDTQDLVLARYGQYLNKTMGRTVGNSAIQVVHVIAGDLIGYTLLASLGLGEPHARDFRVGEGRPGNNAVVRLKPFETSK